MSWKERAAEILNQELELDPEITAEDLESIRLPNFSAHLNVGQAIEEGDAEGLMTALTDHVRGRPEEDARSKLMKLISRDTEELEEADNPYAGGAARGAAQTRNPAPNNMGTAAPQAQQEPDNSTPANNTPNPEPQNPLADAPRKPRVGDELGDMGRVARVLSDVNGQYEVIDSANKRHVVNLNIQETTTAGCVAGAAQPVGKLIRRVPEKPRPKTRGNALERRRKK